MTVRSRPAVYVLALASRCAIPKSASEQKSFLDFFFQFGTNPGAHDMIGFIYFSFQFNLSSCRIVYLLVREGEE